MLSVTNKPITLSVVMLNVVMLSVIKLSVVAPKSEQVFFIFFCSENLKGRGTSFGHIRLSMEVTLILLCVLLSLLLNEVNSNHRYLRF